MTNYIIKNEYTGAVSSYCELASAESSLVKLAEINTNQTFTLFKAIKQIEISAKVVYTTHVKDLTDETIPEESSGS